MIQMKKVSKGVIIAMGMLLMTGMVVDASEGSARGERERELSGYGSVHEERYKEILDNLKDYAYVEDFRLTRYIPRDATESGWENTTKSIEGKKIKSVHWYKDEGNWIFSSASAERYEIAKDEFKGRYKTETSQNYQGDPNKMIWQLEFSGDVSTEDRLRVMPSQCKASVQYYGDPFTGAHGFVDWGSVAADVKGGVLGKDAKLFIEGYGKGDVHDVGGGVKGRHLDLFMDNCEEGYAEGNTTGNLVIYEKSKSNIAGGKPVTKEIVDRVMKGKKWGDTDGVTTTEVVQEEVPFVNHVATAMDENEELDEFTQQVYKQVKISLFMFGFMTGKSMGDEKNGYLLDKEDNKEMERMNQ